MEWYDFFLFGTMTAIALAPLFFPDVNPTTSLISAFLSFAAAFVARPIGAVIFGHFGDRLGRRGALIVTVLPMGVASTLIGALPTYETAGVLARFCCVYKPFPVEEIVRNIEVASQVALSEGIASITEPGLGTTSGLGNSPLDLHAFQTARERGVIGLRAQVAPSADLSAQSPCWRSNLAGAARSRPVTPEGLRSIRRARSGVNTSRGASSCGGRG